MSIQSFFVEHGRLMQILGVAVIVIAAQWSTRKAKPKFIDGWVNSTHSLFIKILSLIFAAFITAAILFNGITLFAEDWWVILIFLLLATSAYWFFYEVFFSTIRWNEYEVEVRRFPFKARTMLHREIIAIKFHGITESVTLHSESGKKIWFPYSHRIGISGLFTLIRLHDDDSDCHSNN